LIEIQDISLSLYALLFVSSFAAARIFCFSEVVQKQKKTKKYSIILRGIQSIQLQNNFPLSLLSDQILLENLINK
jgi:hypothetical protein